MGGAKHIRLTGNGDEPRDPRENVLSGELIRFPNHFPTDSDQRTLPHYSGTMKNIRLPSVGRNKTAAFGIAGALAALLPAAGAPVGVQGYNDESGHRCKDPATAAGQSAAAAAAAQEKASAARAMAAGFDKTASSAVLAGVEAAGAELGTPPAADCSTREQAAALAATTETVAATTAALESAAGKLSDHEAFRTAKAKRITEKKAADEAAAAAKKKADDEAAAAPAKQPEEAVAAEATALAAAQIPALPQVPASVAPAPVHQALIPAPAPAPAPAGASGGTGGGGGCTQVGDTVFCTK